MNRPRPELLPLLLVTGFLPSVASAQLVLSHHFDVGQAVPDNGERLDVRTLAHDNGPIAGVEVSLGISGLAPGGGFNGDLYVSLGHEDRLAILLNRAGRLTAGGFGYADNGLDVTFADNAANGDVHSYRLTLNGDHAEPLNGPLTGLWAPDGRNIDPDDVVAASPRNALLAELEDITTAGEYRLLVADTSAGGTHQLDHWALHLRLEASHLAPLGLEDVTVRTAGNAPLSVANDLNLHGGVRFGGAQPLVFSGEVRLHGSQALGIDTDTTFQGTVTSVGGAAGLVKTGDGTLTLAGAGTYGGATEVAAGRLLVNNTQGSATGTGAVIVRDGASFGGDGVITGGLTLESGATVTPGNSVGTLTVGATVWEGGAAYEWEINLAGGEAGVDPGWDLLRVNGALDIQATVDQPFVVRVFSLTLDGDPGAATGFDPGGTYLWTVVTTTDGITGFAANRFTVDASGFQNANPDYFRLEVSGSDLNLAYVVPEPSIISLALVGAGALWWRRRRSSGGC